MRRTIWGGLLALLLGSAAAAQAQDYTIGDRLGGPRRRRLPPSSARRRGRPRAA